MSQRLLRKQVPQPALTVGEDADFFLNYPHRNLLRCWNIKKLFYLVLEDGANSIAITVAKGSITDSGMVIVNSPKGLVRVSSSIIEQRVL